MAIYVAMSSGSIGNVDAMNLVHKVNLGAVL